MNLFLKPTGKPEIIVNGTAVSTKEDDIAHFTCKSRGSPRPFLRWKRHGVTIKDADEGVAVLEKSNSTLEESHLFVAVTDNERRGIYICVARNEEGETTMSFKIGGTYKLNIITIFRTDAWGGVHPSSASPDDTKTGLYGFCLFIFPHTVKDKWTVLHF